MFFKTCLSVYMSIHLAIEMSICLSAHMNYWVGNMMTVHNEVFSVIYLPIPVPACLYIYISICTYFVPICSVGCKVGVEVLLHPPGLQSTWIYALPLV